MDGIELMAEAMSAAKAHLERSATNLANLSTHGFQRSVAHATLTAGGIVTSASVDATPGPLRHTGRAFDLAVAGRGAFFVSARSGEPVAIRSASLVRDGAGHLRDERGRVLLGMHGAVVVAEDAMIDLPSVRVQAGTALQSGFLEAANVDGIREMVEVLGAQRAFETAEQTLAAIDDVRSKAVNDLARIKA